MLYYISLILILGLVQDVECLEGIYVNNNCDYIVFTM